MTDSDTKRAPLTNHKLADFAHRGLRRENRLGWEAQSDLSYELADQSDLTIEEARLLISAAGAPWPVILTWDVVLREYNTTWTERKTRAVNVTDFFPGADDWNSHIRVAYIGFEHPVYLSQIRRIETFEGTTEYFEETK